VVPSPPQINLGINRSRAWWAKHKYRSSSSLSLGFQKPHNIQYPNLMDRNGTSLLNLEPCEEITSLVTLQCLNERISEFLKNVETAPNSEFGIDDMDREMHIQIFVNEYQEWNIRTPDDIKNLRASLSLLAFPPLPQFFAAGLIIRKQRTSPSSPASPTSQSSPTLTISFAVPSTPPAPLPRPPTQTSIPASQPQNPTLKPCSPSLQP
jgi:hypothetical protein